MAPSVKKAKGGITKPNWLELPIDLTKNILERLDTVQIVTSARNVCPLWWNICKDPLMWRTIRIDNIHYTLFGYGCLEKICRLAVDLSCGQVEDINIDVIGTDALFKYIAHRETHLRRLRLCFCGQISSKRLSEFVKFSLLEEIEILYCKNMSKDNLELIGRCCPLLKSLNFGRMLDCAFVNEPFAIAKTMTRLSHLELFGVSIDDVGLFAILDGCPLLHSLDLEGCCCEYLSPSLEKRCHGKIRDFRPPKYRG
ncbi:putative F-box/LRR-repeat protein 23 [Vicia villosa]|uniref:putative F-box/LRR-repeat protein 23 n=1 Tax=Vicia villosa TaxID=3911 RepID=UPI00273C2F5F|nr:putative F-box/LRR-repeat protein 23 [Vicia villosa]